MTDLLSDFAATGRQMTVLASRDGVSYHYPIDFIIGNSDACWLSTGMDRRSVSWDRAASLSYQPKLSQKIFGVNRQRLMVTLMEDSNPKVSLMSHFDRAEVKVSKPAELLWDFARGDSLEKLAEIAAVAPSLWLSISEDGDTWIATKCTVVNAQPGSFTLQTPKLSLPELVLNSHKIQDVQLEQIYGHLTMSNTHQPEDAAVRDGVAEFKMNCVDMWRGIFENGVFISAYSAEQGKSFSYKELKIFSAPSEFESLVTTI